MAIKQWFIASHNFTSLSRVTMIKRATDIEYETRKQQFNRNF